MGTDFFGVHCRVVQNLCKWQQNATLGPFVYCRVTVDGHVAGIIVGYSVPVMISVVKRPACIGEAISCQNQLKKTRGIKDTGRRTSEE